MAKSAGVSISITASTAAVAATTVVAATFKGSMLRTADYLTVDAVLLGPTGGTLDTYLQRRTGADDWTDWVHFSQVAAVTASRQILTITGGPQDVLAVGGGTTAAPGVALLAAHYVNVMPSNPTAGGVDEVRIVLVSGAGTSVASSQKITLTPFYSVN